MSTTSTNTKTAGAAVPAPPSKPIEISQSQLSLLFANLHPILLLSLIIFSFKSLVQDPVNTLIGLAPTTALLQGLYCFLCLPSTGQAPPPAHKPGQKKKAVKPAQDTYAKLVPALLSFILTIALTAPLLYILIVLFGAPLTTHNLHTVLLSLHLALLTTPQLFYAHGLETSTWLKIASLQLPIDELYGMSLGACVGAWVGAIPIPLDWDRAWQRWPVTIVVGVYIGAAVGKLVGGWVFKGGRIKIS